MDTPFALAFAVCCVFHCVQLCCGRVGKPGALATQCNAGPSHINPLVAHRCRSLEGNRLSGSIPPSWNVTGSFSALTELALDGNPGLCDSAVPALLQPAVCDSQATNCASGQISCQPVAPP